MPFFGTMAFSALEGTDCFRNKAEIKANQQIDAHELYLYRVYASLPGCLSEFLPSRSAVDRKHRSRRRARPLNSDDEPESCSSLSWQTWKSVMCLELQFTSAVHLCTHARLDCKHRNM